MALKWEENEDFASTTSEFISWFTTECSAKLSPKVQLADLRASGRGRGVIATHPILQGEQILEIPRDAVLCAENSKLCTLLPDVFDGLDPWLSLTLVLIYELLNKEQSRWKSYIDILPIHLDNLVFWTEDELQELQGSHVKHRIGKDDANSMFMDRIAPIVRQHPSIFLPPQQNAFENSIGKQNLLDLCHWAGSIISSYAFDLEKPDSNGDNDEQGEEEDEDEAEEEVPKGMIPMADMLNADADRYNARLFANKTWTMEATRAIEVNEEILNDFGEMPSSELLRKYGYVTGNYSKYDVVEFAFEEHVKRALEGAIDLAPEKKASRISFLKKHDILDEVYLLENNPDGNPKFEDRLLYTIFTLVVSDGAFQRLQSGKKIPKVDNDASVLDILMKLIRIRMDDYATSIEEDNQLLRGILDKSHLRFAIMVRLGEKILMANAFESLQTQRQS
ncbi:MAG: hypothetical protein M1834_000311 [Cirrosporium novae-zelandiae]|nr:MAG: hypothetical protein M1834_000311 [Cirrosporium novae-zelandiae]